MLRAPAASTMGFVTEQSQVPLEPDGTQPPGREDSGLSAEDSELSQDERAELERLRAETAALHGKAAANGRRRRHFSWRAPVAIVLIVLGCVLAPDAVLGVWAGNLVSNTSRYVATVQPLIDDPAIQNVLTDKITNQITSQLNVTGVVNQASTQLNSKGLTRISSLLTTFGPQIASAVNGFIHSTVHTIITSQAMAKIWVQVNTIAHQAVVKVLSGQSGGALSTKQRPDRAQSWSPYRRGQATAGGARVLAGEQHPDGQRHRAPVPGQGPGEGAGRLPSDQGREDRAAHTDAASCSAPGCSWRGAGGAP